MPTYYVDSGSFKILEADSIIGSVTGSLLGSASYATTSSWVKNSQSASYWSGSITNATSASQTETASYVVTSQTASYWSGSITNATSASFASTSSYLNNLIQTLRLTGSIIVSGSLTGSLSGSATTASYVQTAQTASYWSGSITNALSASFASTASWIRTSQTASYWSGSIINALSASQAETASWVKNAITASYFSGSISNATSASYASTASYVANAVAFPYTGSARISGSLDIKGSGSVLFSISGSNGPIVEVNDSGSSENIYGIISGSVYILQIITGSVVIISGSLRVTNGITGSLLGSASYALTASYVSGSSSVSASYASTASWVKNAQTASYTVLAQTASYFNGFIESASFAATAAYFSGSISNATSAETASYLLPLTQSLFISGTVSASNGITGSLFGTSSHAVSASWAPGGSGGTTTGDNMFQINANSLSASKALNILTDGATITWHVSASYNAKVTLAGNRTLAISGSQDGDYLTLLVVQDLTGSRTLMLPITESGNSLASLNPLTGSETTLVAWYRSGSYDWRSTQQTQSKALVLSSDFRTAATSASNTPLQFAIQPNETYYVTLEGSCYKDTTATGLYLGVSVPTGSRVFGEQWGPGKTNLTMLTRSLISSSGLFHWMNTATNLKQPFAVTFAVMNSSSAGFVTIQAATRTSNFMTLNSGSRLSFEKAALV